MAPEYLEGRIDRARRSVRARRDRARAAREQAAVPGAPTRWTTLHRVRDDARSSRRRSGTQKVPLEIDDDRDDRARSATRTCAGRARTRCARRSTTEAQAARAASRTGAQVDEWMTMGRSSRRPATSASTRSRRCRDRRSATQHPEPTAGRPRSPCRLDGTADDRRTTRRSRRSLDRGTLAVRRAAALSHVAGAPERSRRRALTPATPPIDTPRHRRRPARDARGAPTVGLGAAGRACVAILRRLVASRRVPPAVVYFALPYVT